MSQISSDQHFLIDNKVIRSLLDAANLSQNDTVLEVGAGTGNITKELAKRVNKIIAVEIDEALLRPLSEVRSPKSSNEANVEIINNDALKVINQRRDFTKIVGNIPYQIAEALLQVVIKKEFIKSLTLIMPRSFALKANEHPIFTAFFTINIIEEVEKEAFNPPPDTRSVIVQCTRKSFDNDGEQIIRSLYLQKDKKLRNGLREAFIELYKMKKQPLTKKEASTLVDRMVLDDVLEVLISRLSLDVFVRISERVRQGASRPV